MIIDAIRSLMFFLDTVVYWFINLLFELFMLISKAQIFNNSVIEGFYGRVYALVGIFMLFRVSFSILTMIANPETLTNKEQGIGKITTRILVTIILLLFMPNVFSLMYKLQGEIVDSNILGTVILGIKQGENIDSTSIGKKLSYTTFRGFFYCADADDKGNCDITNNSYDDQWNKAESSQNISELSVLINVKENDKYLFEYKSPMSLAAGIFIAYILISFCIDIGVRTVKLGFLQIMAPIPIISYVDPKSSKGGAFNNWVKTLVMTYLDLFIRLIIIFFVVFVLGTIDNITFTDSNAGWTLQQFAKIFIIIGALMFAKQAPGLIKDLFGIKGDANAFGDLNPFKKIGGMPGGKLGMAGAAALGSFAGGGLGMAAGKIIGDNKMGNWLKTNAQARLNTGFNKLNQKNWSDKGSYTGPKTKDLTAQALTGDPNAKGGLAGGLMYRMQAAAQRNLAYNTAKPEKTPELKRAIGNQLNAQNQVESYNRRLEVRAAEAARGVAGAEADLITRNGFSNKDVYEKIVRSFGPTADPEKYYENDALFQAQLDSILIDGKKLSLAEKTKVLEYANKVASDIVDDEQKRMPSKK